MIRKFSVTNNGSNPSAGSTSISTTPTNSAIASPTSQLELHAGEDGKKLYAQSLESTENSVTNSHVEGLRSGMNPLLYPIGSEHDVSTDEGLSMSEEEDQLVPQHSQLNKLLNDLDIDLKLKAAAQRGETDLVKELLCNGAQVVADENGTTAIHVAAQNGFAEVVRLLLEHGTDVDLPDSNGYTALHKAAGQGHLDVLELLINEGCDIDTQDDTYGNTPLHEAAWHGYSKSVDLLLKNKSNAFITNRAGCTPLHLAAQNGHNQSGRTLLYSGCSPDVKNNYGDTPLHTAARYGHAGIARILISARCSVNEQNKNGDTALHITSAFKRRKIAKLLMEAGIGSLMRNKQDETAVDIAKRKGHPEIIEIIYQPDKPMHTSRPSEEQQVTSVDPAEVVAEKDAKKKSHNAFVSWIRKRFSKKSSQPHKKKAGGKQAHTEGQDMTASFNNQYIKKPGFAYYRDLAGNIRQGPCGFVPACHCEPATAPALDEPPAIRKDVADYTDIKESQQILSNRMMELRLAANKHRHMNGISGNSGPSAGRVESGTALAGRQQHLNNTEKNKLDINEQLAQVENDLQELRGDLKTWLTIQAEDENVNPEDNPFAYAIGHSQTRFGDDFDHERMARLDVTEQFPPPPRLFRSRSDETLSHSEYSYHGRAFKSKEAAMEELKTLKHHEELRARRRKIRAAGDEYDKSQQEYDHRSSLKQYSIKDSQPQSHLNRRHSSKPNLWQSRENIRQKDILDNRSAEKLTSDTARGFKHPETKLDSAQRYNEQMQSGTKIISRTPRPVANGSNHLPANRVTSTTLPSSGQPATYRLISAALANRSTQNNQSVNVQSSPIQARRAQPTVNDTTIKNTIQSSVVPHQRTFNGQQANLLYSELPSAPSRAALPDTRRQLGVEQKQGTDDLTNSRLQHTTNRQPLPSYSEVQSHRHSAPNSSNQPPLMANNNQPPLMANNNQPPLMANNNQPPLMANNNQRPMPKVREQIEPNLQQNKSLINVPVAAAAGESCCGSSNPDSGYGGQSYDFYAGQPSPQIAGTQSTNDYNSWYSRRLQDAARRINMYSALRPQRTMTSDV